MACSVSLSVLAQMPLHHPRPSSFVNTGASELIPIEQNTDYTDIYYLQVFNLARITMSYESELYIVGYGLHHDCLSHFQTKQSKKLFPQISQLQANNCTHFTWIILHVNCILYSDIWRYTIEGKSKPFQPINLQTLSCDVLKDQIEY